MLALALTLTLSTIHQPSSLRLIEAQADAAMAPRLEARGRLLEIETELASIRTTWPTGSVVLMAVGFSATITFPLIGLGVAIALGGLPGILILSVGLAIGGLTLMLGLSGVIWGAVQSGANRHRARRLEEERALLLREADGGARLGSPALITLATF
jgi:hypothetical protein